MKPTTTLILSILVALVLVPTSTAQQQRPSGRDRKQQNPVEPDSKEFKARQGTLCDREFRFFNGVCTSFSSRLRKLWGSTNRPHFTYFANLDSTNAAGRGLPSARLISNILCKSSRDIFDSRGLNEMATFFGQFIDHTIVATPSDLSEPFDIDLEMDDPLFSNKSQILPFFRSTRVRVTRGSRVERPQNSLTSAIDLASVYGPSKIRNNGLRAGVGGFMEVSAGNLLPLNVEGFNNAPDQKNPTFFLAGDHRANEHPVLTSLHVLFLREHNDLARELKRKFPSMPDQDLFDMARKINGAQMQKIVFKDWYESVTGEPLPKYRGFNPNVDPTVSVLFSTAAFRVGHTMVGNQVNRRGRNNKRLSPIKFKEMFFKTAQFIRKRGIEEFLRGALVNRAQKVDLQIRDSLRNFLFKRVDGEDGIDLAALNIQRGRDHALPSYNKIRVKFGMPRVTRFKQITKNTRVQSALATAYKTVDRIEAWPGLLAEDLAPRSSLGPTMLRIWRREFSRLRDGDSFYFEIDGTFSAAVSREISRVAALSTNEDTFRAIVLRNSKVKNNELSSKMFFWK